MSDLLDKTKPFGQIHGKTENNARYTQDGKEFDGRGVVIGKGEVGVNAEPEPEPESKKEPKSETVTSSINDLKAGEIKELVQKAGGVYKNKAQGIKFLENVKPPSAEDAENNEPPEGGEEGGEDGESDTE